MIDHNHQDENIKEQLLSVFFLIFVCGYYNYYVLARLSQLLNFYGRRKLKWV